MGQVFNASELAHTNRCFMGNEVFNLLIGGPWTRSLQILYVKCKTTQTPKYTVFVLKYFVTYTYYFFSGENIVGLTYLCY